MCVCEQLVRFDLVDDGVWLAFVSELVDFFRAAWYGAVSLLAFVGRGMSLFLVCLGLLLQGSYGTWCICVLVLLDSRPDYVSLWILSIA